MSRASLAGLLLVAGLPLAAQEAPAASSAASTNEQAGRWGIGVSLSPVAVLADDFGFLPIGISNILIPIRVGEGNVTIEPEFGIFRTSSTSTGGGGTFTFKNTRVGIGFLMPMPERDALRPYMGGRVGVSRSTSENSGGLGGSQTFRQNNWYISGVAGAQHFFSRHFSLGGEVQLTRTNVGDETGGGGTPSTTDQSFVSTAGLMMLRWFF